jgi:glycine/sarcosine N-methyltransferase
MSTPVLTASEFYTRQAEYRRQVDPTWEDDGWEAEAAEEGARFAALLGDPAGRSVLDCACGPGMQAIPLVRLGWRVTGSDITAAYMDTAKHRARVAGVEITFVPCDMRELRGKFGPDFDWVVCCMALDNILADDEIQRAVQAIHDVLKPGGSCYIRLKDMDNILAARPRFDFREERSLPHGRVIYLDDWDIENETHGINLAIYLREDRRKADYGWDTTIFAYRRRLLPKAELVRMLEIAGFARVELPPQPSPWHPYSLIARKPS